MSELTLPGPRRSFPTLRATLALILREMSATYGRSPGGYAWAFLEPAGGIALLTLLFSLGFRAPPVGTNFPIFYATGMVPFVLYLDISNKLSQALLFSRQLLAYPSVTFLDALLARFLLNLLTQLLVGYVIFAGILLFFETRTTLAMDRLVLAYAMAAALALGVGTLNCLLISRFPMWQQIWSILNRPLFILSCIFFTFDSVPEPYRALLWFNPVIHIVGQMRSAFFGSYDAPYVSPAYVFAVSLLALLAGLIFLRRHHRDIINY